MKTFQVLLISLGTESRFLRMAYKAPCELLSCSSCSALHSAPTTWLLLSYTCNASPAAGFLQAGLLLSTSGLFIFSGNSYFWPKCHFSWKESSDLPDSVRAPFYRVGTVLLLHVSQFVIIYLFVWLLIGVLLFHYSVNSLKVT